MLRHTKTEVAGRDGDVGVTNGTTEVEVVPAPPAGARRILTFFHTRNINTGGGAGRDVTLRWKKTAGSLTRDLHLVSNLASLASWDPIPSNGGIVMNADDESVVVLLNGTGAFPWSVIWEDFKL